MVLLVFFVAGVGVIAQRMLALMTVVMVVVVVMARCCCHRGDGGCVASGVCC